MALTGVIIGSVALVFSVIGIPTLLHVIFAKPNVKILPTIKKRNDGERLLRYTLHNKPRAIRFLRLLNIKGQGIDSLSATHSIIDQNRNIKIVDNEAFSFGTFMNGLKKYITLQASETCNMGFAHSDRKGNVYVGDQILKPGMYRIEVCFTIDSKKKDFNSTFFVSSTEPFLSLSQYS